MLRVGSDEYDFRIFLIFADKADIAQRDIGLIEQDVRESTLSDAFAAEFARFDFKR
ncbi:hypothetical protein TMM008_25500 [Pseudomonas sp. 008]|nr:hypothetical protein TMM008_25500 [Pseudomonas sp. 008]